MEDLEKIKEWIKIAENKYFKGEIKQAHKLFLKCEVLAKEIGNEEWIAETKKNVGRTFHRLGKYREAKVRYIEAIKIINRLNIVHKKPRYLNHLANVYQYLLEFDKDFECLIEALEISEKLDDRYLIAKIRNSLGVYYEVMGDYEKALNNLETAQKLYKDETSGFILAKLYNIIASVKTKMGENQDAMDYVEKAYKIALKNDDLSNKAYALRNKIRILYNMDEIEECMKYFDDLLLIKDQIENIQMKSDIQRVIGQIYQKRKDINKAFQNFRESLEIANGINFYHGIAKNYEYLGNLSYEIEKYLDAYMFYTKALNNFKTILNSIVDPKLKITYKKLFERLPIIIGKVDKLIENRFFEINFFDMEEISESVVNICITVHKEDIDEEIAQHCYNESKKLKQTKNKIKEKRAMFKKEWLSILPPDCFLRLNKEAQVNLIDYKILLQEFPERNDICIQVISKAIESELKLKIIEKFRTFWIKKHTNKFIYKEYWNLDSYFKFTFKKLIDYLDRDKFLDFRAISLILTEVFKLKNRKNIPDYLKPFKIFKDYIKEANMSHLKKIIDFLKYEFKCGENYYDFIYIRNICSHGVGTEQEKRKSREIKLDNKLIKKIENQLIDEDIKLLYALCSLEI